jgi:hypothetical protein
MKNNFKTIKTKNIKMCSRTAVRLCGHCSCLLVLLLAFSGCKKDDDKSADTPPLAATTQTWTFGDQIWSDAIQCPECNKETFVHSDTEPQCRSYTHAERGKTYYYYNWPYVNQNATKLCPSPWRVPTVSDFHSLNNVNYSTIITAWGLGGGITGACCSSGCGCDLIDAGNISYHWSSDEGSPREYRGVAFRCYGGSKYFDDAFKHYGLQVRCVKDKK